jgi:hypothetical protein
MHAAEKLTRLLRDLVAVVAQEAESNPAFAERLAAVLAPVPEERSRARKESALGRPPQPSAHAPDVFAVLAEKGEEEFGFWLRGLDLATLKAVVKQNGFDPGKTTRNWKEPDKFSALIQDQVAARLRRGSAFLSPRSDRPPESNE